MVTHLPDSVSRRTETLRIGTIITKSTSAVIVSRSLEVSFQKGHNVWEYGSHGGVSGRHWLGSSTPSVSGKMTKGPHFIHNGSVTLDPGNVYRRKSIISLLFLVVIRNHLLSPTERETGTSVGKK